MKILKISTLIFISFVFILYIATGCDDVNNKPLKTIEVSNIYSDEDKSVVKTALLEAGINENNVNLFLENVSKYNEKINGILPYKDGFTKTDVIKYDYSRTVDEFYNKEPNSIGSNCRINTFLLYKENININNSLKDSSSILAFDKSSLQGEFKNLFNSEELSKFETFYAPISAKYSNWNKDQIAEIEMAFSSRGISFKDSKAKMITVWLHDNNDIDGNILFIGHTGVLVPYNDKYLFIEKLSFNEPYQAVILNSKRELSDYLMEKYDVEYNQNTTRPFVMDNDSLLDGFRQNPLYDKLKKKNRVGLNK